MSSADEAGLRSGKLTRNVLLAYFLAVVGMFFGLLLISYLLFPAGYSIVENTFSNLGREDINPAGWIFFSLSLWIVPVAMIPFYVILLVQLKAKNKVLAIIMFVLYLLASTGMFMVGTFQEGSNDKLHLYSAYVGLGGFFLAGIFTWILAGMRIGTLEPPLRKKTGAVLAIEIAILSTAAAAFITQLVLHEIGVIDFSGEPISVFIGFPFTEWMLVYAIFIDKVFLAWILSRFLPGG